MRSASPIIGAALLAPIVGAALIVGGCGPTVDGFGEVQGDFTVSGCSAGEEEVYTDYGFSAQYVATKRLVDNLEIVLLEYPVDLEETDGLVVQIESVTALRAQWAAASPGPLTVQVTDGNAPARAALSLFSSCPRAPTLQVVTGTLTFTRLALAADPDETGTDELITGTLTASVSSRERGRVRGGFRAVFDFVPQNAPQLTPR